MINLGTHGFDTSAAFAINDVGEALNDAGARRATFWPNRNHPIDIDPSTGISSEARAISNRGVILGNAAFSNPNDFRAVLWHLRRVPEHFGRSEHLTDLCKRH